MRQILHIGALLCGMVQMAHAQALDIGGIELSLGQNVNEALHALSPYQVQYSSNSWIVTQKVGKLYQFLGSIGAKDNKISFISKSFEVNDNESTPGVYTIAAKYLRKLGGETCVTIETEYTDNLIHGFDTQCGKYKLGYLFPSKTTEGDPILGGISISVGL